MDKIGVAFLLIFLAGAALRSIHVAQPIDQPSWRECDLASIARNYYREGMNLFYPRVDWRGDGPGYAEMEFPIYPWTMAALYHVFGYDEIVGRLLVYGFSLVTLATFLRLARFLMAPLPALAASVFFVLSPLSIEMSTAIQPEGLMIMAYLLAVYHFLRWIKEESLTHYTIALLATALALLAKVPSAHVGLLFACLVLQRWGLKSIRQPRILLFAVGAVLPALAWHLHARQLWLTYGNSLGVSNEYHWIGWDFFTNSKFLKGIFRQEIQHVWMPAGVPLLILALCFFKTQQAVRFSLLWLLAIFAFYVLACRTAGNESDWAYYYHIFSVAPAALLVGCAVQGALGLQVDQKLLRKLGICLAVLALTAGVAGLLIHQPLAVRWLPRLAIVAALTCGLLACWLLANRAATHRTPGSYGMVTWSTRLVVATTAALTGAITFEAHSDYRLITDRKPSALYLAAQEMVPLLTEPGLIVCSGGLAKGPDGYPVAYNASYFFYWLDRDGFNVAEDEQSVAYLRKLQAQGVRYFVAEKRALQKETGFTTPLGQEFILLMQTATVELYLLNPRNASNPR